MKINGTISGLLLLGILAVAGCLQPAPDTVLPGDAMVKEGDAPTGGVMEGDTMEHGDAMEGESMEGDSMEKEGTAMEGDAMDKGIIEESPTALNTPFYEPFTLARYEQAKAEGKTIFLEFYANWCPVCKAQAPALEQAFMEIDDPSIAGFRVNYKDSDTDGDEQRLAQQFGITYQHTHVVINSSEEVLLKELTQWGKDETIEKITAAAGA